MDAEQIQRFRPRLDACLGEFDDCLARCEPVGRLQARVMGQLSDLPGKSIDLSRILCRMFNEETSL